MIVDLDDFSPGAKTIPPGKWTYSYGSLCFVSCLRICNSHPPQVPVRACNVRFSVWLQFCMIRWFYSLMHLSFCHLSSLWPTTHLADRVLVRFRDLHSTLTDLHSIAYCRRVIGGRRTRATQLRHPIPIGSATHYSCTRANSSPRHARHISGHCYDASVPKNPPMQDMCFHVHAFPISSQRIWWGCHHTT